MMIRVLVSVAITAFWSTIADASIVGCNSAPIPQYLLVDPAAPNPQQQIMITVGVFSYDAQSASIQVQGNAIDVTLTAAFIGFTPPPPTCVASVIGPLAPGTYTVNFSLFTSNAPQLGAVLLTSTALRVKGASTGIPTMQPVTLALLTALLALLASGAVYRRPRAS
jgi:hypothetical protein